MLPYWLLFTVFATGALQDSSRLEAGRARPVLLVAALFTMLMIGLRYEVGGDWFNYLAIFEYVSYSDFDEVLRESDPGYAALNWLVHAAGFDIWLVNLACAALFTWGLMRFAQAQPNPWLAVLVAVPYLIIVVAMGYTRQGVAIGLIMAGLAQLERRTIGRFVIYTLVAALFHKSAIVILPLIALAAVRDRFLTAAVILGSGLIFYYVFVSASLDRLVTNYVEEAMESEGALVRLAMSIPAALAFLAYSKRFGFSDLQRGVWRNFSYAAIGLLLLLISTAASTAVDRIALYLIPLQIAVLSRLPVAFSVQGRANAQLALVVVAYSALIQFVWLNYAVHADAWLPYRIYPFA